MTFRFGASTRERGDLLEAGQSEYVETGRAVNFYTLAEAARRRGETAIGYRLAAQSHDVAASYGIHINPAESEMIACAPEDKVIIIVEE